MPVLIPYLLAAALAFGAGWTTNGWRLNAELSHVKQTQAEQAAKELENVRATENGFRRNAETAAREAQKRGVALSAAAADSRAESERLRVQLAEARARIPGATRASLDQYTATLGIVFDQCEQAYQDLARAADGHASDARTLIDSWPTKDQK